MGYFFTQKLQLEENNLKQKNYPKQKILKFGPIQKKREKCKPKQKASFHDTVLSYLVANLIKKQIVLAIY